MSENQGPRPPVRRIWTIPDVSRITALVYTPSVSTQVAESENPISQAYSSTEEPNETYTTPTNGPLVVQQPQIRLPQRHHGPSHDDSGIRWRYADQGIECVAGVEAFGVEALLFEA